MGATAARAWEAYTTAAERQEWFGAEEGSAELDVRVGGAWECVLLGPDGGRYPLGGTFLEVEEGRRLVLSMAVPGAPDEVMGVTFEESGAASRSPSTRPTRPPGSAPGHARAAR
ncbi:SRPBCC domain-containing protein [Streptomyces sp. AD16]|nr:SRPBCC domain-containing protein [Streptomyces sp. AD16]